MGQALSEVKRRIATAQQLRKVTSTLQKVAAARFASSRRLIELTHCPPMPTAIRS